MLKKLLLGVLMIFTLVGCSPKPNTKMIENEIVAHYLSNATVNYSITFWTNVDGYNSKDGIYYTNFMLYTTKIVNKTTTMYEYYGLAEHTATTILAMDIYKLREYVVYEEK